MKTFLNILYIIFGYIFIGFCGAIMILLLPALVPMLLICALLDTDNKTIKENKDNEGHKGI